ncbi:MAG: hypothetical protein WD825_11585 [Gemmatimonadaceae bacterium]
MSRLFTMMAVALTSANMLIAQGAELHPRSPIVFLEKTYFFPLAPYDRSLRFEGEAAGHYFIVNRLDWTWTKEGGWRYTVPISMVFHVRMLDITSEPVRTPSYRIGLRPQFIHASPVGADPAKFSLFGISGGFTHYSNGQQGCTYLGFSRPAPDADCVVSNAALAAQRRANTIDGDFSTSYLSLAIHGQRGRHYGLAGPTRYQHIATLEFQAHPIGLPPGGMNTQQALEYGQHVARGSYEFELRPRRWVDKKWRGLARLGAKGGYRFSYKGGPDWTFLTLETSYVFDCLQKFGGVFRTHLGSDYYNINFQDTRPLFAVGLMWDLSRIDAFNRTGIRGTGGRSQKVYTCTGD